MKEPFQYGERYVRCVRCGIARPHDRLSGDHCADAELCMRLRQDREKKEAR